VLEDGLKDAAKSKVGNLASDAVEKIVSAFGTILLEASTSFAIGS